MIDTSKIIMLHQPLCMVELVKGPTEVKPLDGGYFGVPYLLGIKDGEFSTIYSDWGWYAEITSFEGRHSGGANESDPSYDFSGWTDTAGTSRVGLNFTSVYADSKYQKFRIAEKKIYEMMSWPDGSWQQVKTYDVYQQTISVNVPRYIYLAKVDGMPYHFATEANAQKWIDKTLEREMKTKPKQGADREKKFASLSAYRARVNKKWQAAKLRSYQNDDLKKKVLDMLVREYREAGDRLMKI